MDFGNNNSFPAQLRLLADSLERNERGEEIEIEDFAFITFKDGNVMKAVRNVNNDVELLGAVTMLQNMLALDLLQGALYEDE